MKFLRYSSCVILCLGAACESERPQPIEPQSNTNVHWSYEGETGPEHWADLNREFAMCREGIQQSPIDLSNARVVARAALSRKFGETVITSKQRVEMLDLIDNGHTIQVTDNAPMAVDLEDEHYDLVQYHFHAPSEHTLSTEHAPLEVHFVHQSATGKLLVLAVLVVEGAPNPNVDILIDALPSGPGDARHIENLGVDIDPLLPLPERFYRYHGSLTTPPCSEGVEWFVFADPLEMSAEQLAAFASHLHHNNRPVQPLGERELELAEN